MNTNQVYHYVYRITNTVDSKHYYGSRSSSVHPTKDLGKLYFSSSTDTLFVKDQKIHPQHYKYKIVAIYKNRVDALALEAKLHQKFDVKSNPSFYNKANQTSSKFSTASRVTCVNTLTEEILSVPKEEFDSKEWLIGINAGRVPVRDHNGNTTTVSKNDFRYLSGELVPIAKGKNKGKVIVKDLQGKVFTVNAEDPKYLSGQLLPVWLGRAHKQESKDKIGKANSINLKGEKNPNYGNVWVSYPEFGLCKRVKKELIDLYYDQGWSITRKGFGRNH